MYPLPVSPNTNILTRFQCSITIRISTLIQLRFRIFPSLQRSTLLAFYSHTHLLPSHSHSHSLLNLCQPLNCSSFLRFLSFLRQLYKGNHIVYNLWRLPVSTNVSMQTHSGCCMYEHSVSVYCEVVSPGIDVPYFV